MATPTIKEARAHVVECAESAYENRDHDDRMTTSEASEILTWYTDGCDMCEGSAETWTAIHVAGQAMAIALFVRTYNKLLASNVNADSQYA